MRPLAVSMGDPAGVGLEIIARIAARGSHPDFFLIGDADALMRAAARAKIALPAIVRIARAEDAANGALCVLDEKLAALETPGAPNGANASAVERAIVRGVEACLSGAASGLVTLPIAKATLYAAGFRFPGHTEFIGELTKHIAWPHARGPVMLLANAALKVALATIHTPLAEVSRRLTAQSIVDTGLVVAEALTRDFGVEKPRIALCGLNPHAGENGALGREEIEIINPAAAQLRALGVNATDAAPADTMFHAEARAGYDAAIAMYHDQALIPSKTLDFWGGVNVTLGLPIIRTSPDHGTALEIAGRGIARDDSVRAALDMAHDMAKRRLSA
ncbi:MAG: 4-hydroxythreonine-4-phosphate dehydrogenase PdxA [Caulobacterales bacterium]